MASRFRNHPRAILGERFGAVLKRACIAPGSEFMCRETACKPGLGELRVLWSLARGHCCQDLSIPLLYYHFFGCCFCPTPLFFLVEVDAPHLCKCLHFMVFQIHVISL
ncbi:hypothetical protein TRVL_09194 [Trypanosoma vivax]|nr:hypothetical protein TRVL_09194 [Trypanosoma vivax]